MKSILILCCIILMSVINAFPVNDTSGFYKAVSLYKSGKFQEAKAGFDIIAARNVKFAPVYYYLGLIAGKSYDFDKAESYYKKSLKYDSTNSNVYCELSILKYYTQNNTEARKYIEKAIKLDPRNVKAYIQYASLLNITGETEKAKNQLNKAARIDSNEVLNEANRLLNKEKKPQSALFFFNLLIELYPKNIQSYFYAGFAYKSSGDISSATQSFKSALNNCNPKNPLFDTVYATYFNILMKYGKFEDINFTSFDKCGENYAPAWYYNALANYALKNRVAYLKGGNKYFELTVKPYPASLEGWLKQELARERE
jgi:tetratricopeptide (TPR) repeat protein